MGLRRWQGAFSACAGLAAAAGGLCAASASAGIFHVYSCHTPSGESVPADGWSAATSGATAVTEDTCTAPGGGLLAAVREAPNGAEPGEAATWRFAPPSGLGLAAAALWRAGDADGGQGHGSTYEYWLGGPSWANAFDECAYSAGCTSGRGDQSRPLASENLVVAPPAGLGAGLYAGAACAPTTGLAVGCYGVLGGDGDGAVVVVYAADLTLEQVAGPTVVDVGGELASATSVRGASDVRFTASDPASGIFQALTSVDGAIVQRTPLDDNGGRCRDAGQTSDGSAAFLYLQPCVASVSADVSLDTTALANGEHDVVVSVLDAAGNSTRVLARTITVANPLSCDPAAASGPMTATSGEALMSASWRATRTRAITSGFARAQIIDGRLTDAAAPIAGAPIEGSVAPISQASTKAASVLAHTDAQGRFSVRMAAGGPSRVVCLSFRGATLALRLGVRASVSLRVSPRTASVGRTIRIAGALGGGYVPRTGKAVILEARSPGGRWIEFRVVRADARGRFHTNYRFRFAGPATYEFRALCEPEFDYPFARGHSNAVRVREH